MQRRHFIKQTAAGSALLATGSFGLSAFVNAPGKKHITILHTNDTHSRLDPFPANDARYANKGGVARRATLIENIRKENQNTLLLDAGDYFQGTPYFNFYGGELELKFMSMLGYDAATIGNHEFDNGLEGLLAPLPHANFPIISSNYNFSNTVLDGFVEKYRTFEKDGIKVGVFGLGVELEGLVTKKLYQETRYQDPIEISQEMTRILKDEEQCDLIICLSHLGYSYEDDKISDIKLAKATKNIDLILGGHTHTFLLKPTIVKNIDDQEVLINQVGFGGINLGRIDFYFEEKKINDFKSNSIMV
ncbi:bifunctional metallophosphatase/5'-nucleotidase [Planktosalinus lacus]|uniref:Metallophosphatase n=1 Tax=Planktosalinus lacus TaxID=1526573 RepID=A0A8J2VAD1_9FLAO|nr:metallophosphatase [Planktosalinus lacus]GGD91410.1 metallophosphatase [Planktosalinus lacus]